MLGSQSRSQKTQILTWFPLKTCVKYFRLAVGPRSGTSSQKWPKTYFTYDVTHKKTETQNQKNCFHCTLEDLPSLL